MFTSEPLFDRFSIGMYERNDQGDFKRTVAPSEHGGSGGTVEARPVEQAMAERVMI